MMRRALWILVTLGLACGGSGDDGQDNPCADGAAWFEDFEHASTEHPSRGCALPDGICYGYQESYSPIDGTVSSYGSCYYGEACGLWRLACIDCESPWLLLCAGDCPLGVEHERCD